MSIQIKEFPGKLLILMIFKGFNHGGAYLCTSLLIKRSSNFGLAVCSIRLTFSCIAIPEIRFSDLIECTNNCRPSVISLDRVGTGN